MTLRSDLEAEYRTVKEKCLKHPSPTAFHGFTEEHVQMAAQMNDRERAGMFLVVFGDEALAEVRRVKGELDDFPRHVRRQAQKGFAAVEALLAKALGA